jgi:mannose-6-phosphate isomerase-like protein (cupin superfamily)
MFLDMGLKKLKMNSISYTWGAEIIFANTEKYSGKTIIVLEGEQTPYIYHKKKDKTLFVLQGVVQLVVEGKSKVLQETEDYHIPPKIMHRIIALKGDATILEVGTKIEDDIVIIEE